MTTATKPKAKKKISGRTPATTQAINASRVDPPHESGLQGVRMTTVPISSIRVIENDRKAFDPDELNRLADSIQRNGVLQPLVVTADGDGWRLIAGERRLRAATLAGEITVPVVIQVGDISTEMIREQRLVENIHRVDLTAIEKAQAIAGLLESMTQKEAAAVVGCTQAQLSNTVRLLELPEIWQQWVAAGKLAPTAVRPLLPWASKRPQVLQWLVDRHSAAIDDGGFEINERTLQAALCEVTRPLNQSAYHDWSAPQKDLCWFKYDAKKHAELLDVEEIDCSWRGKERRAWNLAEFDRLNAEPLKKAKAKYKAAVAARKMPSAKTGEVQVPGAEAGPTQTPFTEMDLRRAISRQMLHQLANRTTEKSAAASLPSLLLYLCSTESGNELSATLVTPDGQSRIWPRPAEVLDKLVCVTDAKTFLPQVLSQHLRWEAGLSMPSDGLDEPALLVRLAKLVGLDLLEKWTPDRAALECCEAWFLREVGRKAINLPDSDQPETLEEIIDWLESDWPEGHVPAQMCEMLGLKK